MNSEEFIRLAGRISNGTASRQEIARYNYYYNKFQSAGPDGLQQPAEKELIDREMRSRLGDGLNEATPVRRLHWYWKAAAILLLASAVFFIWNMNSRRQTVLVRSTEERFKYDAAPGGNNAVLTLANGSTIVLEEAENGILTNQDGALVSKKQAGQLVYNMSPERAREQKSIPYNTISTPAGGRYQVRLPDGTNVWLNSASSLKFPAVFTGAARKVQLTGEAYFEVARKIKNRQDGKRVPFIVIAGRGQVEVSGTHFNINAYKNENVMQTTLLEGSVNVSGISSGTSRFLKPGQQALLGENSIRVRQVDVEDAVAWKNGIFQFNNTDMQTIMRQLERWYNVEADEDNMPQRRFYGSISRDVPLSQVLKLMEITSDLKFKIEELPAKDAEPERRIIMAE